MSNISNTKKYAALWLHNQGKSPQDIAKELSIQLNKVEEIISETPSQTSVAPNSKNLMITHTAGKKANHVAIMTKEASELNDSKLKNMQGRNNNTGIFRPKSK
jgi:hypothetical protein